MNTSLNWKKPTAVSAAVSAIVSAAAMLAAPAALYGEEAAEEAAAQPLSLQPVLQAEAQLRASGVSAQEQVNDLASARQDLMADYRRVQKELDIQKLYNAQLQAQIRVQDAKKLEIRQAIEDVSRLQRQIPPLSGKMLESLADYIRLDLPFHIQLRTGQIEMVRQSMVSADIKPSEQLRQILELYDIEMQYSRTIDTYDQFIDIDNHELEVSVLRWGRLALLFLSKDESTVGIYNAQQKQWQALPSSYRNDVRKGLRMARKQASLDLLLLPVPAAVKVSAAAGDDS